MGLIDIRDDGPVRWVRLADGRHNALTEPMVAAITDALELPGATRVVVLAGTRAIFCSGADPDVLAGLTAGAVEPTELVLPRVVLGAEVPVVAAMTGHAIGGGLVLGLCADVVLFAAESRYGATFMNHGFTPGMGATRLLEKVMRPALAHELLLGGEPWRGAALARHGVANVWLRNEVETRAEELAWRIADKPRSAVVRLKRELARPWQEAFEAAHPVEARMHRACFAELRRELAHA